VENPGSLVQNSALLMENRKRRALWRPSFVHNNEEMRPPPGDNSRVRLAGNFQKTLPGKIRWISNGCVQKIHKTGAFYTKMKPVSCQKVINPKPTRRAQNGTVCRKSRLSAERGQKRVADLCALSTGERESRYF
jgi:hypothetical protein